MSLTTSIMTIFSSLRSQNRTRREQISGSTVELRRERTTVTSVNTDSVKGGIEEFGTLEVSTRMEAGTQTEPETETETDLTALPRPLPVLIVADLESQSHSRSSITTAATTTTTESTEKGSMTTDTNTCHAFHPNSQCSCDFSTVAVAIADPSSPAASRHLVIGSQERKVLGKKLVRKLDICLLPVLIGMCVLQAVDKGAIGVAKIDNIEHSLSITQTQYNFSLSIFYIGYLAFQVPSNLLISRIHPGLYLSTTCLLWSMVGLSHAFVHSYAQLLSVRLLLGICDAPFLAGTLFLLSCWYAKRELAVRVAMVLVCTIVTMTGFGPVAAGIVGGVGGKWGWEGWRWVYFVFGLVGLGGAFVGWIMLPGYPRGLGNGGEWCGRFGCNRRVWWLSEQEVELARLRIEEERIDVKKVEKGKLMTGFKDAVWDLRVWVFALMMLSRKTFEGLWQYEIPIIKSMHLVSSAQSGLSQKALTLLLSAGPAGFSSIVVLGVAYSSDRCGERTWHIIVPLIFTALGLVVGVATLDSAARYTAMFVWDAGALAGIAMTFSWVASTIQETPEKKAVAIAIVTVLAGVGSVAGPFLFRGQDAPGYRMAFGVLVGFVLVDICCVLEIRLLLGKANKRLKEEENGEGPVNLYEL